MSHSERFAIEDDALGFNFGRGVNNAHDTSQQGNRDVKSLFSFLATGLGSRGGPNKESNKLKRNPKSYLFSLISGQKSE